MFRYVSTCGIVQKFKNLTSTNVKAFSLNNNNNNNRVQQPSRSLQTSNKNTFKLSPSIHQSCLHILHRRRFSTEKPTTGKDKDVPTLMYFQDPRKYVKTKYNLMKLRLFWDSDFDMQEFVTGSRQAAVVVTDLIRTQNPADLEEFTTSTGFRQISRDMYLSKEDPRMQLIDFRQSDIRKAMPVRTVLVKRNGRKHCFIDMFFAGLRNSDDFEDLATVSSNLKKFYKMYGKGNGRTSDMTHLDLRKVIFAEIVIRFYRDYSPEKLENWDVSFYKVVSFDVLSSEKTK